MMKVLAALCAAAAVVAAQTALGDVPHVRESDDPVCRRGPCPKFFAAPNCPPGTTAEVLFDALGCPDCARNCVVTDPAFVEPDACPKTLNFCPVPFCPTGSINVNVVDKKGCLKCGGACAKASDLPQVDPPVCPIIDECPSAITSCPANTDLVAISDANGCLTCGRACVPHDGFEQPTTCPQVEGFLCTQEFLMCPDGQSPHNTVDERGCFVPCGKACAPDAQPPTPDCPQLVCPPVDCPEGTAKVGSKTLEGCDSCAVCLPKDGFVPKGSCPRSLCPLTFVQPFCTTPGLEVAFPVNSKGCPSCEPACVDPAEVAKESPCPEVPEKGCPEIAMDCPPGSHPERTVSQFQPCASCNSPVQCIIDSPEFKQKKVCFARLCQQSIFLCPEGSEPVHFVDPMGCESCSNTCVRKSDVISVDPICPEVLCKSTDLPDCPARSEREFRVTESGCSTCEVVCAASPNYVEPDTCKKQRTLVRCFRFPPHPTCSKSAHAVAVVEPTSGCKDLCGSGEPDTCTVPLTPDFGKTQCPNSIDLGCKENPRVSCPAGTKAQWAVDAQGCTVCRRVCAITSTKFESDDSCKACPDPKEKQKRCPNGSHRVRQATLGGCEVCNGACVENTPTAGSASSKARSGLIGEGADTAALGTGATAAIVVLAVLVVIVCVATVFVVIRTKSIDQQHQVLQMQRSSAPQYRGGSRRKVRNNGYSSNNVKSGYSNYALKSKELASPTAI